MNVTRIKIKKGLDVPLAGAPQQIIEPAVPVSCVALIGADYIDMKPSMLVEEGDRVKLGQPLFEDKRNPGVLFTAPAAGTVSAINRGARRVLQSVVIAVDGDEAVDFGSHAVSALPQLARETVRDQLVQSGLWTALRTRPYNKTPAIDAVPAAIFVSALDTNPLAADPAVVLAERAEDFKNGLAVLSRLTEGELFVCKAAGSSIPLPELPSLRVAGAVLGALLVYDVAWVFGSAFLFGGRNVMVDVATKSAANPPAGYAGGALTIPPAYPAPSPTGKRPVAVALW